MTAVARTLRGHLTPAAFNALQLTVEWAALWNDTPWTRDHICRLSVLTQTLARLGGTWQDVLDLHALHDDFLNEFLDPYHAATAWGFNTDHYRLTRKAAA